jgi:hypothetical protein
MTYSRVMLTVETAGSYIVRYGSRSETIGTFVHCRCAAGAQLMSVTSSPGGTWSIFIAERKLPVLAAALAACFSYGGGRLPRL